jgi:hypothetical protein
MMPSNDRDQWNACRFDASDERGHYESYFQRANHPERPLGFWIRYTLFSPRGRAGDTVGEKWAVFFDGEQHQVTAIKEVVPFDRCFFSKGKLEARVDDAELDGSSLRGTATSSEHAISWSLDYTSPQPLLLFFPKKLYSGPFPKARALVGSPNAVFNGTLDVDGRSVVIDGWLGSQNHNWGEKHTDDYAWGQVAEFDGEAGSFLECATARVKLGPVWSPRFTLMVLRLDGKEYRLNTIGQALRAHGRFDFFSWDFESKTDDAHVAGQIAAPADAFVGLPYDNPPGGQKTCLNSKIARCQLTVRLPGQPPRSLVSEHRAAFEILTDARDHGVRVLTA